MKKGVRLFIGASPLPRLSTNMKCSWHSANLFARLKPTACLDATTARSWPLIIVRYTLRKSENK